MRKMLMVAAVLAVVFAAGACAHVRGGDVRVPSTEDVQAP